MKILASSCIHNDIQLVKKLANRAEKENVDLVILCGDFTHVDDPKEGLIKHFIDKGKKVMLIPGNHETNATADFLAELYNIFNLHGTATKVYDIGFFGCGHANVGTHQISEDEIYYTLKHGFHKIKGARKTIMVTHVHPSDSLIAAFTNFVPGSEGVRRAIDSLKPDILLCGHVHEAEGVEEKIGKTRVINVCRSGRIIEV